MWEMAEEAFIGLNNCLNGMSTLVKRLKSDSKEVDRKFQ